MKRLIIKVFLSIVAFVAANAWLINKGIAKGAVNWFISPVVEETVLFIILQLFMFLNFFIYPLKTKKKKIIFWCVSELLVIATVWFWGIFVIGPIWFM